MNARPRRLAVLTCTLAIWACGTVPDAPNALDVPPGPIRPVASRLPVLSINTANLVAVTSREVYLPGSFKLTDTSGTTLFESTLEIK